MTSIKLAAYLFVAVMAFGCSNSGLQNHISPEDPVGYATTLQPELTPKNNHYLWGLWGVRIDANKQSAIVIPLRMADIHLNVVRKLEVEPCTNCLRIDNVVGFPPDEIEADVTLRHPYPGALKFTGFDVRGIFITGAGYAFPVNGRSIAWGNDFPRLLNPDGYTSLFNPTEFPDTLPVAPIFKYDPGKYATGGDLSATLNPYFAYAKDAPRRMFDTTAVETRTVRLKVPGTGVLEFGYAVDASWRYVAEVNDPVQDFPPNANCIEAYRIDVIIKNELASETWSYMPVGIEVFDHQGFETIATVTAESPLLFIAEVTLDFVEETAGGGFLYEGLIGNELGAQPGEYPLLVRVVDTKSDPNLGQIDAWNVACITVARGWAQKWGDYGNNQGYGVALDGSGNIYVTGRFTEYCDFDPGPGVDDDHTYSNDNQTAFLSKFDSSGAYQWARTWGGSAGDDEGHGVAIDGSGNVYIVGSFYGTVDFDPGPGVEEHTADGGSDIFLSKFDSDGNFIWAITWNFSYAWGIAIDEGSNVLISGSFNGTVDFDPGPGVDEQTAIENRDILLCKLDSNGAFQWARTWGGDGYDSGRVVAVDGNGAIYVTGGFYETVDFNPGPGIDEHTSNGEMDIFLNKFNSNGDFLGARTWGGIEYDEVRGVAADDNGNVYVSGWFEETVDFDPGPGIDEHISYGKEDIFLSKFDSNGGLQWARTCGGTSVDECNGVGIDGNGNIYVTGYFHDTVDFDPGPEISAHTSNGWADIFASKFDSNGNLIWANTWGGISHEQGEGVVADGSGNAYFTGWYRHIVDFDPGPGVDEHPSKGNDYEIFLSKFPPDGDW